MSAVISNTVTSHRTARCYDLAMKSGDYKTLIISRSVSHARVTEPSANRHFWTAVRGLRIPPYLLYLVYLVYLD